MKNLSSTLATRNTQDIKKFNTCLLDKFVQFADISNSSIYTYTKSIRQFFKFLADMNIMYPTNNTIIEYKKYMQASNKSAYTIALYLTALKRFFSWLETEGLYPNITVGVKAPRKDKGHAKDAFNGSQIREIISNINTSSIQGLRDYAILALMASTGLRCIEVTRANVEDLRLNSGVAVLYVQGKGKSSKADFVKLPDKVLAAIRLYLKARGNVRATDPLFASCSRRNKGGRLTTRTISSICKKAMTRAGFISTRLTAHSLRHSSATLALMAGQSLQDVQMFMRHSNINTTLVYSHNISRLQSQCESKIADLIF